MRQLIVAPPSVTTAAFAAICLTRHHAAKARTPPCVARGFVVRSCRRP